MKRDFVVMLESSTLFGDIEPAILEKLAALHDRNAADRFFTARPATTPSSS